MESKDSENQSKGNLTVENLDDQDKKMQKNYPATDPGPPEGANQEKVEEAFQEYRTKHRAGFDPYKKADIELAKKHREAKLVRKLEGFDMHDGDERCECCGYPVSAPEFPICADLSELNELGPGFHMYYMNLKYLGGVFLVGFVLAGFACWIGNLSAGNGEEWEGEGDSFIVNSSVGGQGVKEEIMPAWHSILNIVMIFLVLISYHFLRRRLNSKEEEIDLSITTPSDYTVHVKGLPKQVTEEEVKKFFEENGRSDGKQAKVIKVNFPYDISEYVDINKQAEDIKEKIKLIKDYTEEHNGEKPQVKFCCCFKKDMEEVEELEKQLVEFNEKIKKFDEETQVGVGRDLLVKQAFVTFNTQADARAVEDRFGKDIIRRTWDIIFNAVFGCFKKKHQYFFKGHPITASIAPEPSDIFWENLGYPFKKRIKYVLNTYLMSFLALGASFGMVFGCSQWQDSINEDYYSTPEEERNEAERWNVTINSIWPAIFITIINFALARGIRYFSSFERHHTLTDYNFSVAFKLTWAQFINTGIIAITVNADWESRWFAPGGLAVDVTYILLSNAIIQPLAYYLSPMMCLKKIRMKLAGRSKFLSQGDANDLFEGPQVDMAQRYANVMKTMLVTFFYAPIIPLGFLISIVAIVLEYWMDKYLLLRRHSRPNRLSGDLSMYMTKIIPWGVLLYAVMNFVYMDILNPDNSGPALACLIVVVVYIFIPIELLFGCCKKVDVDKFEKMYEGEFYEDSAVHFIDDYDRENPITNNEGWKWYIELLERKKVVEDEKINNLKEMFMPKTSGNNLISQNIHNYANSKPSLDSMAKKGLDGGLIGMAKSKARNFMQKPAIQNATSQLKNMIGSTFGGKPNYSSYSNPMNQYTFQRPMPQVVPQYSMHHPQMHPQMQPTHYPQQPTHYPQMQPPTQHHQMYQPQMQNPQMYHPQTHQPQVQYPQVQQPYQNPYYRPY